VTLPPEELPLEAPFVFAGNRVCMHPCRIAGPFEHVKIVDDNNAVLISCGIDDTGPQIVDRIAVRPVQIPIIPPALVNPPTGVPPAPGAAPGPDPLKRDFAARCVGSNQHDDASECTVGST